VLPPILRSTIFLPLSSLLTFPGEIIPANAWKDPRLSSLRIVVGALTYNIAKAEAYMSCPELPKTKEEPHNCKFVVISKKPATSLVTLKELEGRRSEKTVVGFEDKDTIVVARELQQSGKRVLALNMANAGKPGGGWQSGRRAQEEELFRR
jgi:hypothetical protein